MEFERLMCVRLGVLIDFATPFNPYGTQWMWVWKAQLEMGVGTFRARGHGLLKQMARPYRIRRPKCFRELPNRNKCHKNDVLQNHSCQAFQLTLARDQLSILEGDLVRNLKPVAPVVDSLKYTDSNSMCDPMVILERCNWKWGCEPSTELGLYRTYRGLRSMLF